MKYAAIDIGSNAIRLLIAEIKNTDGVITYKKNTLLRVPLRLGDDSFIKQHISDKKEQDLLKTMSAFKNLMEVHKVEDYMACGTSAMREADNGKELVDKIKKEIGLKLEIVEGAKEAKIIYASQVEQILDKSKNYLYIDVGGGSTELSLFTEGVIKASKSFNLGTIRILDNQDKKETWEDMRNWIKDYAKGLPLTAIGTGGNINKIFRLADGKEGEAMSIDKLNQMNNYLNSFSLKERINVLGLNRDRADVIIPAADIFLKVMKWGGVKNIYVPRVGMVDGIIKTLITRNFS